MNYTELYKESVVPTVCTSVRSSICPSVVENYPQRYRTEIQSEEERTNVHALGLVISQMNKELEHKRIELERCKKGLEESDRLLTNAVDQLQQIQTKVESVVKENKRLKYAGNEFKRMGVIEERDRLLVDVARLKYELKCSRESNVPSSKSVERCWY